MSDVVESHSIWMHSSHLRKKDQPNVVFVKEKIVKKHKDGSISQEDNLRRIDNPKRSFWVTKPEYRNHTDKKEFEELDRCDQYVTHDSDLEISICNALGYRYHPSLHIRRLCNSPFLYGADIPTEVLIRKHYLEKVPVGIPVKISRGSLDIENEVTGDKRINLVSYAHEHQIYTAALREYMKYKTDDGTFVQATEDDAYRVCDRLVGDYYKKNNISLTIKVFDTELEMLTWIFEKIHYHKTDYIGIWNMSHDIPHIIDRIVKCGGDPREIMCHPEVPKTMRFVEWFEDKSNVDHFTDKWHWVSIPGYSQFIDSMCLYSRVRKTQPRESSYSLDAICQKYLGSGKLELDAILNHRIAQETKFLDYLAYNTMDVAQVVLLEEKTNDMRNLFSLTGASRLADYGRQQAICRNRSLTSALPKNRIVTSVGEKGMLTELDMLINKVGGTVLPPNKGVNVGIAAITESDKLTQVASYANDIDVSSMYPSIMAGFNISKETKTSTVVSIDGYTDHQRENLFGSLTSPIENAVDICHNFFNLASYTELEKEFREYINS